MTYLDWTKEKVTYILSTLKNKITDMLVNKKDIIEITQAEYDALPDTKLTDGKVYAIKDGKGGGGGGSVPDNIALFGEDFTPADPVPRDADTLGGHEPSYYAKASDVSENKYSTEETIIGTWIDGKPLYRLYLPINGLGNAITHDRFYDMTNKNLIKLDGFFNLNRSDHAIPINAYQSSNYNSYTDCEAGYIRFMPHWSGSTDYKLYGFMILEYTKTTD